MKGTKLWQAPGSPIIQGKSRLEKPFWQIFLAALFLCEAAIFVGAFAASAYSASPIAWMSSFAAGALFALFALPGAAIGAANGVWLARAIGSRRASLFGAAVGVATGALSGWALSAYVLASAVGAT